jgi:hypothetical protein
MTIGASFRQFLVAQPGIPESVYPSFLPAQHEGFPAITYNVAANGPRRIVSGISNTRYALIDVDCWAKTIDEVEAVAAIVNTALVDYFGPFNGFNVSSCWPERDEFWLYEDASGLYRVSMQFALLYG